MNINHSEWICLDEHGVCTEQHLTEVSGLSNEELNDLIDNGVIIPIEDALRPKTFSLHYIVIAKRARRLRDDFELDQHGVVLALTLMRRIDELQQELKIERKRDVN
jgi:chaperone modulatory protein CbpM